MDTEFIYCRHKTPVGVRIEEISGATGLSDRVWLEMARQIWNENGRDDYRSIGHFANGAPFSESAPDSRISVSHTRGMLVVATLPPAAGDTPADRFDPQTALGVDIERKDRGQAHALRERFMNETELAELPDSPEASILTWTVKEALYKAALTPGLDWRLDVRVRTLPDPVTGTVGSASVTIDGTEHQFVLYSYTEGEYLITVAIGERTVTFLNPKS